MSVITLENMEFHAYHGCLEHEKKLGNIFIVTVEMEIDTQKASKTDKLEDTLNYQQVYDIVKEEMDKPANLIEHVGQRVFDSLCIAFPSVKSFTVKLSKLNPPLGGKTESVTIRLTNQNG